MGFMNRFLGAGKPKNGDNGGVDITPISFVAGGSDALKITSYSAQILYQLLILEDARTKELCGDTLGTASQNTSANIERLAHIIPLKVEGSYADIFNVGMGRNEIQLLAQLDSPVAQVESRISKSEKLTRRKAIGYTIRVLKETKIPRLTLGYVGGLTLPTVRWEVQTADSIVHVTPHELMYLMIDPLYNGVIGTETNGVMFRLTPKFVVMGTKSVVPTPSITQYDRSKRLGDRGVNTLRSVNVGDDVEEVRKWYGSSIAAMVERYKPTAKASSGAGTTNENSRKHIGASYVIHEYVRNGLKWPDGLIEGMSSGRISDTLDRGYNAIIGEDLRILGTWSDSLRITAKVVIGALKSHKRVLLDKSDATAEVPLLVGFLVQATKDVQIYRLPADYVPGTTPSAIIPYTLKAGEDLGLTLYDLMFTLSQPGFAGSCLVSSEGHKIRLSPKFTGVVAGNRDVPTPSFPSLPEDLVVVQLDQKVEGDEFFSDRVWVLKPHHEKAWGHIYETLVKPKTPRRLRSVTPIYRVASIIEKLIEDIKKDTQA